MEPVLRPLVYAEPLRLVERHRERGERVFVVSATLQEIVDAIAEDLGFDGALGTICEVQDGRYTGRALRALHAEAKADCVRAVAETRGSRPRRPAPHTPTAIPTCPSSKPSGTRSRSIPIVSCGALRATAGWPVLDFSGRAYPHARRRVPPALFAAAAAGVAALLARRSRGR